MVTRCSWYAVCNVLAHNIRCNSGAVGLQDETGVAASMLPAMDDGVDDDADEEEGDHAGARGLDIEQGNQACSPCLCCRLIFPHAHAVPCILSCLCSRLIFAHAHAVPCMLCLSTPCAVDRWAC